MTETVPASHPWFRFWNGTADDRKLRRIATQTGIQRVIVLGAWAGMMELANSSPAWGCLLDDDGSALTLDEIAQVVGIDVETLQKLLPVFQERRMIAQIDGALHLCNWDKRQFQSDSSTERVRQYRERRRVEAQEAPILPAQGEEAPAETTPERSGNVSGTDQSTEYRVQSTEAEIRDSAGAGAPAAKTARPPRSEPVKLYHEITGTWPNRAQIVAIDAVVSADNLVRWRDVITAWCLRGYKKTRVDGMLDWLRKGIPQAGPKARDSPDGNANLKRLHKWAEREGVFDGNET